LFDKVAKICNLIDNKIPAVNPTEDQLSLRYDIFSFFDTQIWSFLKFFDPALEENDKDNYYYEREWRVLGNIAFAIANVTRVVLPRAYLEKFKELLPEFKGPLTFLDKKNS
jgi:hypothetical protein